MKQVFDKLVFRFSKAILFLCTLLATLSAILVVASIFFNLPLYLSFKKGREISFTEFRRGIPFRVNLNSVIPDSSISTDIGGARSLINYFPYIDSAFYKDERTGPVVYSDTIHSRFKLFGTSGATRRDIKVNMVTLNSGTFYLKPGTVADKFLFAVPEILKMLLAAFCSWQLAKLVSSIHKGRSFRKKSYARLSRIGVAMIVADLLLLVTDMLPARINSVAIDFSASIPNYRFPFQTMGIRQGQFDLVLLLTGCLILIVAKAFQKGNELQGEQELTI